MALNSSNWGYFPGSFLTGTGGAYLLFFVYGCGEGNRAEGP